MVFSPKQEMQMPADFSSMFPIPVIHHEEWGTSVEHMAKILTALKDSQRVISLVPRQRGPACMAAVRVSLSRSRNRNRKRNRPIRFFTLHHEIAPMTGPNGERLDALRIWISQTPDQKFQELLQGNAANVS
jgi:hypothetical protein